MEINLNSIVYNFEGNPVTIDGRVATLLGWVKIALNTPKEQRFTTEESTEKVLIFMDIKKCTDLTKFKIKPASVRTIIDTLRPITPPESFAQVELLMNGDKNIFDPTVDKK